MKKWKIPRLFAIESAGQFFKEMAELNQSSRGFSHRELAKYLKWPVSYIPDLIKNRKPFTVRRSLELAKAFALHPVDAEHLIFLAVASQSKTESTALKDLRRIQSPVARDSMFPELSIFKFEAYLTCQEVDLLGPHANMEKVKWLLKSKGLSSEQVQLCIKLLIEKGLVVETGQGLSVSFEKGYSTINFAKTEMRELQKAFLQSAQNFFDDSFRPATGSSAFVTIHNQRYAEVREKIQTLKNWILEVSALDDRQSKSETILFQLELHLLPIFHPDLLSQARLHEPA